MSEDEDAAIIVMRTSDAKKAKFELNMARSLNDLKDYISRSKEFGPLPRASQRIFHLGRELKTGGRSLSGLGVGRFKVFTVHLLSKGGPKQKENDDDDNDSEDDVVEVVTKPPARTNRARNQQQQQQQQQELITLESSDDDSDDDAVVVEVPAPKRRRR